MRGSRIDDKPRINVWSIVAVAHDFGSPPDAAALDADPLREPDPAPEPGDERREGGTIRVSTNDRFAETKLRTSA
jgi:hypothetical protein